MRVCFGEFQQYEIREGESILELARRKDFPLAGGCFNGGCGVCKVRLSDGRIRLTGSLSRSQISTEEEAQGYTLACRAVPETDVKIDQYSRFRQESVWETRVELVSLRSNIVERRKR